MSCDYVLLAQLSMPRILVCFYSVYYYYYTVFHYYCVDYDTVPSYYYYSISDHSRDMGVNCGELGALPDGWEVRYTSLGRPYYVNHYSRTTQFTGKCVYVCVCVCVCLMGRACPQLDRICVPCDQTCMNGT